MIARRDLLIGATCVAAAGAAYALTPRKHTSLLGRASLDEITPRAYGRWKSRDVTDLVSPKIEGSLVSRLYSQTVGRIYTREGDNAEVMMLLAYGDTQSDDLQLHRPEICYPFFGFAITQDAVTSVNLPAGVNLPARRLVAKAPDRQENILYWSRLGEFFPGSRREQQVDRLRTAFGGYIADGLLARFSVLGEDVRAAMTILTDFTPGLVMAVAPQDRAALIGTRRAQALRATAV